MVLEFLVFFSLGLAGAVPVNLAVPHSGTSSCLLGGGLLLAGHGGWDVRVGGGDAGTLWPWSD